MAVGLAVGDRAEPDDRIDTGDAPKDRDQSLRRLIALLRGEQLRHVG